MESIKPQNKPLLSSLYCAAFGHDYITTQKITNHISEYKCSCCGREVSDSLTGKYELLTVKKREVNDCLSSFFQKKKKISLH